MNTFSPQLQSGRVPNPGFGASNPAANLNLPFLNASLTAPSYNTALGLSGFNVDTVTRPNNYVGLPLISVAAHYISVPDMRAGPNQAGNPSKLDVGMLLFARDLSKKNSTVPNPTYGVTIGANTCEFIELSQLNSFLEEASDSYKCAADIIAEWRLMGVLKNSAAPTNMSTGYGNAPKSRIINLIVSHRVSMLNYWSGLKILESQKLYLIVRKENDKWVVVPWSSSNLSYPSLKDIISKQGIMGAVIYVGKSSDQDRSIQTAKNNFSSPSYTKSLVDRGIMKTLEVQLGV